MATTTRLFGEFAKNQNNKVRLITPSQSALTGRLVLEPGTAAAAARSMPDLPGASGTERAGTRQLWHPGHNKGGRSPLIPNA